MPVVLRAGLLLRRCCCLFLLVKPTCAPTSPPTENTGSEPPGFPRPRSGALFVYAGEGLTQQELCDACVSLVLLRDDACLTALTPQPEKATYTGITTSTAAVASAAAATCAAHVCPSSHHELPLHSNVGDSVDRGQRPSPIQMEGEGGTLGSGGSADVDSGANHGVQTEQGSVGESVNTASTRRSERLPWVDRRLLPGM